MGWRILASLNAIELTSIPNCQSNSCDIRTPYNEITNSTPFRVSTINIGSQITNFTNYSTITSTNQQTFNINTINTNGSIANLTNYGTISGGIYLGSVSYTLGTITNYGEMRGVWAYGAQNITIDSLGIMKTAVGGYFNTMGKSAHFAFEVSSGHLTIKNFTILINESQSEFNNFGGYDDRTNNKN